MPFRVQVMMGKFGCFLVASAMIVAGCKRGPGTVLHSAPPPQLQGGWITHETKYGFSIAGPDNYRLNPRPRLDLSSMGLSSDQPPPPEPPDVLDPADAAQQEKDGVLLLLYDRNARPIPGEARTRMWVKKYDVSGNLQDTANDFRSSLGSGVQATMITLPIGPAAMMKKSTTGQGGDVVDDIYFIVVNGDNGYKFTFEMTNNSGDIAGVSQPMMDSLRFK